MPRERGYISQPQVLAHGDWARGRASSGQLAVQGLRLDSLKPPSALLDQSRFVDCGLDRLNLNQVSLRRAELTDCSLTETSLELASLKGAEISRCDLSRSRARLVELDESVVRDSCFARAALPNSRWSGARVSRCDFTDADLYGARLDGGVFEHCRFGGVRLAEATVAGASFLDCDFAGAHFAGARLDGVAEVCGGTGWPPQAWTGEMQRCLGRVPERPDVLCRDAIREILADLERARVVAGTAGVSHAHVDPWIRRYQEAAGAALEFPPQSFVPPVRPDVRPPTRDANLWHCITDTRRSIENCFQVGASLSAAQAAFAKERDVSAEVVADVPPEPGRQWVRMLLVRQSFPCDRWVLLIAMTAPDGSLQGHRILEDETGYRQLRVAQYLAGA